MQYALNFEQSKNKKMNRFLLIVISCLALWGSNVMAYKKDLKQYRARRALTKKKSSAEPYGSIKKSTMKKPLFVIQKHDASHLHYDFRLEVNGVLISWAVPKGLPEKFGVRHLAVQTDDHPMEYADFEGIIPEGHYGGGTVMVWDIGTYENIRATKESHTSMETAYNQGTIEVFLYGKKLCGAYALVKTKYLSNKDSWIILKMKQKADKSKCSKKKVKKNVSALTGRTLKEITDDHDAEWE